MWTMITLHSGNDRGPLYMEQAFCAMHAANATHAPMTLGYGRCMGQVGILYATPPQCVGAVETQLAAAYPDCSFLRAGSVGLEPQPGETLWWHDLWLAP